MNRVAEPMLNLYTPQRQSKQQLLAEFIDRKGIRERILGILRHNAADKPQQHVILIGPRGMGKTTLLCAIRYSVEEDAELGAAWLPLQFYEEQYNIGDLADFWLECLRHLEHALDRCPEAADRLLDESPADLAGRAQARFFEILAETGKRALLLVDNLQEIFAAIDDGHALHKLRALWMTDPRMTVIGAAPSYFEEITAVDQAFHDFFRPFVLERLSQGEMETCLRHYADILKDDTVPKVIEQAPERVAALRILTGGNPRLVKLGYRVLRDGLEGDLRQDLERLLDEATPFFKHRIDSLAKEARRAFDAIAKRWDPVTVDDIRKELRKPSNYVSAQIKRLVDDGFIEEIGGEKKKLYQVSERFYNVYYLWRLSREGRRKLRWLVGFMRVFYNNADYKYLSRHIEAELASGVSGAVREEKLAYLHAFCSAADSDGRGYAFDVLVRDAIARNDRRALDEQAQKHDPIENHGERYVLANLVWLLDCATRQKIGFRPDAYGWWHSLRKKLIEAGLLDQTLARIEELGGWRLSSPRHAVTSGLMMEWLLKPKKEIEAAFSRALELDPAYADAWLSLGVHLCFQSRLDEAEIALRKSLELKPEDAFYWYRLGIFLHSRKRFLEAEAAYKKSLELDSDEYRANLGLAFLYLVNKNLTSVGILELIKGISSGYFEFEGHYLLSQHWQAALSPTAAKITANEPGADNLRIVLTEVLLERAAAGEQAAVRDALLALDETGQAIFEPLLLALRALDDRAILQRIAREKRDLVQDVMQRIAAEPIEAESHPPVNQ